MDGLWRIWLLLRIRETTKGLTNNEFLAEVDEFIQQNPPNAFVHMQAAELYSSRGFNQESLKETKLSVEIEPAHPLLYLRLAEAARLNKDPELARQALSQGWEVYKPLVPADQIAIDREFWFGGFVTDNKSAFTLSHPEREDNRHV